MYDNVIVGVEGDDDDRRALVLSRRLASPEARLTLVHVSVISPFGSAEKEGLELALGAPGELRRAFADQLALCSDETRLLREHASSVGAGLQAAADRLGADLLVLGSTRRRGLDRMLSGDDVGAALSRTQCAVAVADGGPPRARTPIRRIGVAYDSTPESAGALDHARTLAASLGANTIPFHVVAPHVYATGFGMVAYPVEDPDSVVKAARLHLGTLAGEEVQVVYGDPADELVQFSESVDLLVCGSRRQAAVRRFMFGSTSVSLSRAADCPLIVAPAPRTVAVTRPQTASAAGSTRS